MGTPIFAVPSLNALIDAGHKVVAAVTQPDKPHGRGKILKPSSVKIAARGFNIQVFEPAKLKDEGFVQKVKRLSPDFIVVVAYGKILPESILEIPPKGCINIHASVLPKYRGAAPVNWAIINGEKETGVTSMLMDKGMDTGGILLQETIGIGGDETAEDLLEKLSIAGAGLLVKTISLVADGRLNATPQDDRLATYAPVLKKDDGHIDWAKGAPEIRNFVRGIYPWPGAYTHLKGKLLKVYKGAVDGNIVRGASSDLPPGTVVEVREDSIAVQCGKGVFCITELQPEGGKRMSARDFLKGRKLMSGERLV